MLNSHVSKRAGDSDQEPATEDRRKRDRERKWRKRAQLTLEQRERMRTRDSARKRQERKQWTPEQRQREKGREQKRIRRKLRPFMAIDGEGGGTDDLGRQYYKLMVASCPATDKELVERLDDRKGSSPSARLEFLLSLPADPILVGYGFGYDATQILRGVNPRTLRQILTPRQGKNGPCYTYWRDYAIVYQQGQYLRVARLERIDGKASIIKGSCRTVYETLGFFQRAFIKAIDDWTIGSDEERAVIAENKARRDEFSELTDDIIEYCKLECRLLATLMTQFREVCREAGISPRQWSGAGWLAAALLEKHGIPKRPLTAREIAARNEKKSKKGG